MTTTPDPTPRRPGAARVTAVVAGSLLALLAIGFLAAGGALLWGDAKKDDQGYLSTSTHRFATRTAALSTANLDVDLGGTGSVVSSDVYGRVRVQATSHDGKPVFVGIARTSDVAAYLRGTDHATVTDVESSPFRATYRDHAAAARPAPPATRRFWAASATGTGTRTVVWPVRDGSWSVVVMNADASRGVDAGVRAGATVPFVGPLGWGAGGLGLVLLAGAGALIFAGLRTPRPPSGVAPVVPRAATTS